MNQRDLAGRFSSDVDHLLNEAGLSDPGLNSSDYDEVLQLAQQLTATDFSKRSKIRYSLRRRLLNRIEKAPVTTAEIPSPLSLLRQLLNPASLLKNKVVLAGLIMIFSLITLFSLPGLQAHQRLVELLAQILIYLPSKPELSPHDLSLRWQFRGEGGISSDPMAANGLIYAGSNAGYIYALESGTGREVWRFKTAGGVNFSPTVAGDMLYAVSGEELYALGSETGQEQWRFRGEAQFSTPPLTAGDMIYMGSRDGQLYALAAQNGQEQWRFKAGNGILAASKIAGETLYLGSQDRYLYALELETGQEKWRFKAGNWISAPPVEVAGAVYVSSYDEYMYTLDAETGQVKSRQEIANAVRSSAVLAGGTIYFGSYNSYLYAVEAETGQEKWRFKMGKETRSSPLLVEGILYIGNGDGYLYGLDVQTGKVIEQYSVDSQIFSTPTLAGDTLYFVSGKGELYAIQRVPRPATAEQPETELAPPAQDEPASFQFTPGGWYIMQETEEGLRSAGGQDEVIRFRGRIIDGFGKPVDGFSVQADNGSLSLLSRPSGPNRWQPQAGEGEWELEIPEAEQGAGWWWLTVVHYECSTDEAGFDSQCQTFTRLSASIKVEVVYPDEIAINADWTCHWDCQRPGDSEAGGN